MTFFRFLSRPAAFWLAALYCLPVAVAAQGVEGPAFGLIVGYRDGANELSREETDRGPWADGRERAQAMADKLKAAGLRMGYDLSLAKAREWGLFVSTSRGTTSIGIEEPPHFSEPGVFIVRPDGTLYYGAVQTMPFARPHFDELLAALDFALEKNYPARGEYIGVV